MSQESILERVSRCGVVPVVTVETVEACLPLADALLEGGLPLVEITFRSAAAAEVIRVLSQTRPGLLVGAGTVLTAANLEAAKRSGAAFAVAPGLNPEVVKQAAQIGLPFVPGIATPTDIEAALGLGCKLTKFFPAEPLGGVAMLEALSAPYRHTGLRFLPTGGIGPANLPAYLKVDTVAAVGGTWLARKEDLAAGRWGEIRKRCQAAVESVVQARPGQ